eukprot:scaffold25901_cov60-Phaeocystis_antarctica.AAC.2
MRVHSVMTLNSSPDRAKNAWCAVFRVADGQRGAAAGAGREADAIGGRQQDGLLWSEPPQSRQAQALSGEGVAWWQGRAPGPLRHRRGGGAVRRTIAGGAGGSGEAGCSGSAADERGGAAAGAGGGADAAPVREHDGLLRRGPRQQARQAQALSDNVEARWQDCAPGHVRHRRGGGAERRAIAGGASGSGGAGCSGGAADERGGAAAGAGGGADAARGREQGGLLWRAPHKSRPAQALSGAGEAGRQADAPGHVRHRRGGGAVHRALAGGTGGGGAGGVDGATEEERQG